MKLVRGWDEANTKLPPHLFVCDCAPSTTRMSQLPSTVSGWLGSCRLANNVLVAVVVLAVSSEVAEPTLVVSASASIVGICLELCSQNDVVYK